MCIQCHVATLTLAQFSQSTNCSPKHTWIQAIASPDCRFVLAGLRWRRTLSCRRCCCCCCHSCCWPR